MRASSYKRVLCPSLHDSVSNAVFIQPLFLDIPLNNAFFEELRSTDCGDSDLAMLCQTIILNEFISYPAAPLADRPYFGAIKLPVSTSYRYIGKLKHRYYAYGRTATTLF